MIIYEVRHIDQLVFLTSSILMSLDDGAGNDADVALLG